MIRWIRIREVALLGLAVQRMSKVPFSNSQLTAFR